VLFATDSKLTEFKKRLALYRQPVPEDQKGQSHAGFIEPIEEITERKPADRIGAVLKAQGYDSPMSFLAGTTYTLDIELYRPTDDWIDVFYNRVEKIITDAGGTVLSHYRSPSVLLMRVEAGGAVVRSLLSTPEVLDVDLPPRPDLEPISLVDVQIAHQPQIQPAPQGAGVIGVVDSGLTSAHPLLTGSVAGAFGVPNSFGSSDSFGHGTPVSGIACFGDLRPMVQANNFVARFRIASARVLKDNGEFDKNVLVPLQMATAIRRLHGEFGCKVINISLCDPTRLAGLKPSTWAATLDELARELDIVIVVAAGNRRDLKDSMEPDLDRLVDHYPQYLLAEENRILEPATAANVLSIGSISAGNGLQASDDVSVRPIAELHQPSPFSRVGPGVSDIVKPDFVDFGGTCVFDGALQRLLKGDDRVEAGIVSTNATYLQGLLTSGCGTSFAAPLVAHKAALLRETFPNASANLVRALLALGSGIPETAALRMTSFDKDNVPRVMGHGLPDVERSMFSDDGRVVLYDQAEIGVDHFLIYELPIPIEFQTTKGVRRIDVALAFDPPTRRTRLDYLGHTMSFDVYRGMALDDVFDVCRKFLKSEGPPPKVAGKFRCALEPSITRRGASTLQRATYIRKKDISRYGDTWHIVVKCESGWANTRNQRFAIAVEMSHEANLPLYARVQARLQARVQVRV
jgi:hypothetical protein